MQLIILMLNILLNMYHSKINCRNETNFWIGQAIRQTRFTDRRQVREFTIDDFVGTCGGYIGMFLGYALIQFPQFLRFMFDKIQKEIILRKAKNLLAMRYAII